MDSRRHAAVILNYSCFRYADSFLNGTKPRFHYGVDTQW